MLLCFHLGLLSAEQVVDLHDQLSEAEESKLVRLKLQEEFYAIYARALKFWFLKRKDFPPSTKPKATLAASGMTLEVIMGSSWPETVRCA